MKTTALFTEDISKIITIISVKIVIYFTTPGFFTGEVTFVFLFLKGYIAHYALLKMK